MSRKHAMLASSLAICSASWGLNPELQYAYSEEKYDTDSVGQQLLAQERVYGFLTPITAVAEGDLAARLETKPLTYVVQADDCLSDIAVFFNVPYQRLAAYNHLIDPDYLETGSRLRIPLARKWVRCLTTCTVASVALEYKISEGLLRYLNPDLGGITAVRAEQQIAVPHRLFSLASQENVLHERLSDKKVVPISSKSLPNSRSAPLPPADRLPDRVRVVEPGKPISFAWPIKGMITSNFGWRSGGQHKGIDIWNSAKQNTVIHAAGGGTVVKAGYNNGYGNLVVIDHGGGWQTYYAHLSRLNVTIGQHVGVGQMLGYMGRTGDATGYHLHFEVRRNGQILNPLSVLPSQ